MNIKSQFCLLCMTLISTQSLAIDHKKIEDAINKIETGYYTGIDSVLIYNKNKLISEHYFNDYDASKQHRTHSTFKSITGLITAIAIDENLLTLDEFVLPLLARFETVLQKDERKSRIRVRDLLHMASGLDCAEMPGKGRSHEEGADNGPQPLKYCLSIEMIDEPGKEWRYCNANSFLLAATVSAALDRAGEDDIFKFAEKKLFEPLGIVDKRVIKSPEGFLYGQGNAYFTPRDLAKFGLLLLQKGSWKGKQIVSESHIHSILNGEISTHWSWTDEIPGHPAIKMRYAYQWHRTVFEHENNTFPASHTWGNGGQFVFAVPKLDIVVVFTGQNFGGRNILKQKQAFEIMQKYLIPAVF